MLLHGTMGDGAAARPAPAVGRLVVVNDVASAKGGATGLALQSIRLLRGLGVPVTFIVGDDGGGNAEMAALGVEVVGLGGRHVATGGRVNALANGIHNRQTKAALAAWIAEHDDPRTVYHLHGWSKVLSPSIFEALQPVAGRLVLHAHDFFLACPNGAFQDYRRGETCFRVPLGASCLGTNCDKRSYGQKLWRAARHEALRLAAGRGFAETPVLMIHGAMRPWFERSGFAPERLRTVLNPVAPFTGRRIEAERNRTFYFVGRVEAEKGVFEAAEAARRAGATLKIIGDGPDRAELSIRYPEIEIAGWQGREAIGAMLADARALVMPSRYPEPFGLVAAEASRSGLPVVVSGTALLAADLEAARLGFGCDPRDADGFAALLRRVADLPHDEVRAMSERAFEGSAPISSSLSVWGNALASIYEERLMDVPHEAAGGGRPRGSGEPAPRVRLFNVKYSPNLGDGLLSEALERALAETGCDPAATWSVDMAARGGYGPGSAARSLALRTLAAIPSPFRNLAVRLPLTLAARRRWRPHYERGLAGADAAVIGGGNLFTDMDLNFPFKMATALRLAARRRLPVAIYGVGVSSNWSATGLAMMRAALANSRICYVSVRDAASKRAFDRLFAAAAGHEAEIVRDPGLLASRYAPRPGSDAGDSGPIGLCVTSAVAIRYHSPFAVTDAALAEWYVGFAGRIAASGHALLAFTNGSPEDERFLDAVEARLATAAAAGFERRRPKTPDEVAAIASSLQALAAHRMHALIAAYSFGTPIFALRWDAKVDAFMDSVGAGERIAAAQPGTETAVAAGVLALLTDEADAARLGRETVLGEALDGVRRLKAAIDAAVAANPAKG